MRKEVIIPFRVSEQEKEVLRDRLANARKRHSISAEEIEREGAAEE